MKFLTLFLILLFCASVLAGNETGAPNQVLVVPSTGGRGSFGKVDLSQTAAVKNQLPTLNGGLGVDASAATGVPTITSGTGTISSTLAAQFGGFDSPTMMSNCSITASVSANALTIALKDAAGSTPSSTSPCVIGFRSSTLTTGAYNKRTVNSSLSLVVASTTTIGTVSGNETILNVYAIDNAGTVELMVRNGVILKEEEVYSTSAISGGSVANTNYSTTARTNVPVRLLGYVRITEATAGTWATAPSSVATNPKTQSVYMQTKEAICRYEIGSWGNVCSSSPCTIGGQSGSCVSSITRSGAGDYVTNFATNYFSGAPFCFTLPDNANVITVLEVAAPTSTSNELKCINTVTSVGNDCSLKVLCIGATN